MGSYFRSIWGCRFFWLSLVRMDLRTRYRRSVLGLGWSLLQPIAMTAILCTVFHSIMKLDIAEYGPYVMTGLAFWNYVMWVCLQGCQSLLQGESYIRQHPAPIAIYPLRTALSGAIHFLLALLVAVALTGVLKGIPSLPVLLALIPGVMLILILGWSLAVLASFANVHFQDTQHLAEVGLQMVFYATPIILPYKALTDNHLGWLLQINPFVTLLQLIREPILEGRAPSPETYGAAAGIVLVVAGAAAYVVVKLQRRLIFYL